ncbi:MAG TPA: DUF6527 family protein [Pirellula sp.]|nr:DUF6527 family protein [Pirellula sp.]
MKIKKYDVEGGGQMYLFYCPGCKEVHHYNVGREKRPVWTFNGDFDKPTFSPSLLYPTKTPRCHLFVTDGNIIYCSDCGHSLAGQTVPLTNIPEDMVW